MLEEVVTSAGIGRRLAVLNDLLGILTEDIGLPEQMDRALAAILSIPWLPTEPRACIFLSDEENKLLRMVAHRGLTGDAAARCATVPFGRCVCGHVAEDGEAIFIDFSSTAPPRALYEPPNGHYGLPIRAHEKLLGVLSIYLRPGHPWDPQEEVFLGSVTHVLAAMIDRRQTEDRTRTLLQVNRELTKRLVHGQEEEYRRLARELHDEVGQALTAIRTDAALIAKHTVGRFETLSRSAEAIRCAADHLHGITRSMIRRLRPTMLDDLGLAAALEALVSEWRARRPGLPCRLACEGAIDRLGKEIDITVYRLVQEALTNALRHAAASQVHVTVSCERSPGAVVRVLVEDDGRGMKTSDALMSGLCFGLLGMRERVEGLGGHLDIDSAPGKGLRLRATIPLTKDAASR
jgi:signal transduction histidine kinase